MTLFRTQHNKNYTCINNFICTDNRLSYRAKGIWLYAFSRPDNWSFYLSDIINQATEGRDSVMSAIKELENCGYLERTQSRDIQGKMLPLEWVFFEVPKNTEPKAEKLIVIPVTEKPVAVTPVTEKPILLINEPNKVLNEQTTAPSGVVVFPKIFDKLTLSQEQLHKLYSEYPAPDILLAAQRILAWPSRRDDMAAILTALKHADTWVDKKSQIDIENKNKEYLNTLIQYDMQTISNTLITIGNNYIEFAAGMKVTVLKVTDKLFKPMCVEKLALLGIVV